MLGSLGSTLSNTYHKLCGDTQASSTPNAEKPADPDATSLNGDTEASVQDVPDEAQSGKRSLSDKVADVQIAVLRIMSEDFGDAGKEGYMRARNIFTRDPANSQADCEEWRRRLCLSIRDGVRDDTSLANAFRPSVYYTHHPVGHEKHQTFEEQKLKRDTERIERGTILDEFFATLSDGGTERWADLGLEEVIDQTLALTEEIREMGEKKDEDIHYERFGTRRDDRTGCHCGCEYMAAAFWAGALATVIATGVAGYRWAKAGTQDNM